MLPLASWQEANSKSLYWKRGLAGGGAVLCWRGPFPGEHGHREYELGITSSWLVFGALETSLFMAELPVIKCWPPVKGNCEGLCTEQAEAILSSQLVVCSIEPQGFNG